MEKFTTAFIDSLAQKSALKRLSREYCWEDDTIEVYLDKIDMTELARNHRVLWSEAMLDRVKDRLDWETFSHFAPCGVLTKDFLQKYADYWFWDVLSANPNLPPDVLYEFAHKFDWSRVIRNRGLMEFMGMGFLKDFEKYIPADGLTESILWKAIVKEKEELMKFKLNSL